jgi:hypothetical protein
MAIVSTVNCSCVDVEVNVVVAVDIVVGLEGWTWVVDNGV